MKRIKIIGGTAAILAGTMLGAWGQDFRTDINPALIYYQAFLVSPEGLSSSNMDYLASNAGRSKPLPERFEAIFNGYSNQFRLVRQAAHSTVACDWGMDWSPGPGTLLPQLGRAKAVIQTATFRSRWELEHNQPAEAVEDLMAAFVLARNTGPDGALIGVLVQAATEKIVFNSVAENFGQFSPEELGRIAVGMQTAPPFTTMASAMTMENLLHTTWLPHWVHGLQTKYAGDDTKVMAEIHSIFIGTDGDPSERLEEQKQWEKLSAAAGGTSDGVLKLAQDMRPLAQQLADAMALPQGQFEAATNELNAALQNTTNPLAQTLLPAVVKARPREFEILENEAMVQAAIAWKLNGAAGLNSVTDPCGGRPFQFQRFMFQGVDRGFELRGAYNGRGYPEVMIFVETKGAPFNVSGKNAGQPVTP